MMYDLPNPMCLQMTLLSHIGVKDPMIARGRLEAATRLLKAHRVAKQAQSPEQGFVAPSEQPRSRIWDTILNKEQYAPDLRSTRPFKHNRPTTSKPNTSDHNRSNSTTAIELTIRLTTLRSSTRRPVTRTIPQAKEGLSKLKSSFFGKLESPSPPKDSLPKPKK